MRLFNWFGIKKSKDSFVNIPRHVAIIMDGNGRWANSQGLPRSAGHHAGLERVRDAVEVCLETGVKHLTLFAFSTENWRRPAAEVDYLMNLFEESLGKEVPQLNKNGIQIRFIGSREKLKPSLVQMITESEALTQNNQALILNIAINYGGRAELVQVAQDISMLVSQGKLKPEEITEAELSKHLFTAGQPDPDLLIKPGGEFRISNFLIWQMAYTEFYFSKLYWPDFGKSEFYKAFKDYGSRERRFGKVKEGCKPL